jgi:hypothetical protein
MVGNHLVVFSSHLLVCGKELAHINSLVNFQRDDGMFDPLW